ncbi:hypothetical protein AGDE_17226 [Angomonas deanei]|nr:hypothetical protein AGDE_17226 [Angomonas deanei]|eukprot:EPY15017.1 hypothetical protein AGDE_17226 [Angomonas deanei]
MYMPGIVLVRPFLLFFFFSFFLYAVKCLFIDLVGGVGSPAHDLLGLEPEGNLAGGALHRVGTVAHIAADVDGVVAANGTGEGVGRVGGTEKGAAALDDVLAFPHHADNRAGGKVLHEGGEERLGREVRVVTLSLLLGGLEHLERHQLESLALKAGDDLTDESALDAVRLDGDEGALGRHE